MENKRSFELKENIEDQLKKKTMTTLFVVCLLITFVTLIFIWIKYEVEGAKGLSFEIEEILIVSTADGKRIERKKEKTDNFEVSQVNDVFIKIREKEKPDSDNRIKKIEITNFKVEEKPKKGDLIILEPTGDLKKLFTNSKKNYITDTIEYKGATVDNLKQMETFDKGGTVVFRIENKMGSFNIKKDEVLEYNSKLLNRFVKNIDDIKFRLFFDLIIELDNGFKYSTTLEINKPTNDMLKEKKSIVYEDVKDISFKKN